MVNMKITSSNGKTVYEVSLNSCTCPDYIFRQLAKNGQCKHMKIMEASIKNV